MLEDAEHDPATATATTLDARVLVTGGYDGVILPTVDACLYLP